jgi:hypothetical protein
MLRSEHCLKCGSGGESGGDEKIKKEWGSEKKKLTHERNEELGVMGRGRTNINYNVLQINKTPCFDNLPQIQVSCSNLTKTTWGTPM